MKIGIIVGSAMLLCLLIFFTFQEMQANSARQKGFEEQIQVPQ